MIEKKLVPISLASAEVPKPPIDPDRGERQERGRVVVPLPATMKPCPVVYDEPVVRHDPECECRGTGEVPIRRPEIEVVDPEDDSLQALEDAIETGNTNDSYLGDSVTNLMRHPIDIKGGGGGSGGRKSKARPSRGGEPPPSATDGRLERTGRPPRFKRTRTERVRTVVPPEDAKVIKEDHSDAAALADSLLANPEMQAVLAELKTAARST